MLQIRYIREFTPRGAVAPKKYDKPTEPEILVNSMSELFSHASEIVSKIPESERFNVFYTLGHVPGESEEERKNRKWHWQEVIPFDIDNIEVVDNTVDPKYLEAIAEALDVDIKKCVTMFSGNGLQVLVKPRLEIKDIKFFKKNEKYYQVLCSKINDRLSECGLKGEADTSAFAPNRLFRLPLTLNKKPGKPERQAHLINASLEPVDFDLKLASGLPDVDEEEQLTEEQLGYFSIDSVAVEKGCDFLKWMKSEPQNVTEPEWYAGLSIVGRFKNGEEKAHEYSKGHPSYNERETDRKLQQSLEASGPRTCGNINKLWGRCRTCPNYKKVPSPIALKGADFIATAHSGFHLLGKKGALMPQYEDLKRFYYKEAPYINSAQQHYKYTNTHYAELDDVWIDNYAQSHFSPPAKNVTCSEFKGLIKRTSLKAPDFFGHSTDRHINLLNGILNIDTSNLLPHSPEYGFRSVLPFDYDPEAQCPNFITHLEDITCGDETLKTNLLEFMGYAISNDRPKAQKMLVLTGSGQNGKSTFINIMSALGGDAVTSLGVRELSNQHARQMLDGALFNIIEEMPSFTEKNFWEDMKGLVTGASVTASKKYKDTYTFTNKAKIVMTCNELPKGANPNHGYFRRLLIVPFNATFEGNKDDVHLEDRIKASELPGVLNMALGAYRKLRDNRYKFTASKTAQETLNQYKLDVDNVARWAENHLQIGETRVVDSVPHDWFAAFEGEVWIKTKSLYEAYRIDVESEGEKPVNMVHFARRIKVAIETMEKRPGNWPGNSAGQVTFERRRVLGARCQVLRGVTFLSDAEY